MKTNQIFLDEYMSGDPRSRGALRPETGRGEGSVGWIFTPTGVSTGWILTPAGVSIFHKNDPQRVAKYENFINITKLVAQNEKNYTQQGYFWHPYIYIGLPNQTTRGCTWGEKRAAHPYWLWQKECPSALVKAVWPLSQRPLENVCKYWAH